jgi:hypothetical protein
MCSKKTDRNVLFLTLGKFVGGWKFFNTFFAISLSLLPTVLFEVKTRTCMAQHMAGQLCMEAKKHGKPGKTFQYPSRKFVWCFFYEDVLDMEKSVSYFQNYVDDLVEESTSWP